MLFKIAIICDETPDFLREITIDSDNTFLDLNKAILDSCKYDDSQITSFCTCTEDWEKKEEIVREDMGTSPEDVDIYIMEETRLSDLIEDEEQKMTFTFDPINDRIFFLEVTEIVTGQYLDKPECTASRGVAPKQLEGIDLDFESLTKGGKSADLDIDFDPYGSEGYNEDEYDADSFGIDGED